MAEKKTRIRRKDLRKQRWVAIVAGVLALAMAVSAIAMYSGRHLDGDRGETVQPGGEIDLDAYRDYYLGEVERLEKYIDDYGSTAPVLGELMESYAFLIQIGGGESKIPAETLQGYQDRAIELSHELIEMEPDKAAHRLQLLGYYESFGEDESVIAGEIKALCDLLRADPDPVSSLMLIAFMKSSEQREEAMDEEITWLRGYLEDLEAAEKLDSENRYYYAYLLGQYLEETDAAREQLGLIMEKESEESPEYLAAKGYLEQLQREEEKGSEEE